MKNVFIALAVAAVSVSAFAGELDQDKQVAPQGVLVRVGADAKDVVVYKAAKIDASIKTSEKAAVAAIANTATSENVVAYVKPVNLDKKSELDTDHSTSAWYYYYYGNYWAPTSYFTYYYYTPAAATPVYYNYAYNYAYNYNGYNWYWYWYWY